MTLRFTTCTLAFLILVSLIPTRATAQLDVTFPVSRMIIQRDNNNQARVQIAGSYAQPIDTVEARLVARAAGQGTSTAWTLLQASPTNGQFAGTLSGWGGWYQIEVRGRKNGRVVVADTVDRFGIGEVFAIVGHSNAQGSSCYVDGVDRCPTAEGATDDRVTVVAIDQSTPEFRQYENTANPRYLPGLAFSQLLTYSGMAPFARVAWLWGRMGDLLAQRINVPVLIYNAGFGGTNMELNYKAAYDIPFEHGFCRYDLRMPFVNLRNLMHLYVPTTGIRAILLQHGENDRTNPTDLILTHHYGVIDKSRQEFDKPDLAWIIARSSFVSAPFDNVRLAQQQVINRAGYRTFAGPDLDNITSREDRPDGIHYSPQGQRKAGELWASSLTDDLLRAAQFYPAQLQPLVSIACAASGNQLLLTQPDDYEYSWNTGSTDQRLMASAGLYSARLRNARQDYAFPPAVSVPNQVRPNRPTISPDGPLTACMSGGVLLTSSYDGLNRWSTGSTARTITITSPGTYTLQAQNPVYGCLSDTVTKIISGGGSTDLRLSLEVSRRTPVVGDTVTFTLTVWNESACNAGRVKVQNRLPANVAFVSSIDSLIVTNNVVSGILTDVPPGGSVSRHYVARLLSAGAYRNAAELAAATNPDPDSQPDSGTSDGQDDAAVVDLRTSQDGLLAVYVSPNPNPAPLPTVQSNQPLSGPNQADLSLTMQVSSRTVKIGQPITITLTVANRGGQTATDIGVESTLPAALRFTSSPSGLTATGSLVNGKVSQLAVGQSVSLTFSAVANASGLFTGTAQISASGQPDGDSTPGNGTGTGEDDEATVDLRVIN